jgi:hypothetical protein
MIQSTYTIEINLCILIQRYRARPWPAGDPTLAIRRNPPTRSEAVKGWMVLLALDALDTRKLLDLRILDALCAAKDIKSKSIEIAKNLGAQSGFRTVATDSRGACKSGT